MERNRISLCDIENYIQHLLCEEKSLATIEKYQRDLRHFYRFLPDDKTITKEQTILYKQALISNYSVNSINSMLAALSGFLDYVHMTQYKVKRIKIQRQIFSHEEKELTKVEYERLIRASKEVGNKRLHMIIQTICGTGIRISELKYFTAEAVKRGKIQVDCKGKIRIIFIPDRLQKKLLLYIREQNIQTGVVFITRSGQPVNRSNIWRDMKRLCDSAGVDSQKVFPHNLRHLFARTYYQLEKDITKLADILGHSSIETTRIYVMTTGKEHREQIERLGLVT